MPQAKKDNTKQATPKKSAPRPGKTIAKGYEKPRIEKREKLAKVTAELPSGVG